MSPRALAAGLFLGTVGCGLFIQDADIAARTDGDGDGFRGAAWGGADCDDADPDVHPDASERLWNGVDDNCDGIQDGLAPVSLADAPQVHGAGRQVVDLGAEDGWLLGSVDGGGEGIPASGLWWWPQPGPEMLGGSVDEGQALTAEGLAPPGFGNQLGWLEDGQGAAIVTVGGGRLYRTDWADPAAPFVPLTVSPDPDGALGRRMEVVDSAAGRVASLRGNDQAVVLFAGMVSQGEGDLAHMHWILDVPGNVADPQPGLHAPGDVDGDGQAELLLQIGAQEWWMLEGQDMAPGERTLLADLARLPDAEWVGSGDADGDGRAALFFTDEHDLGHGPATQDTVSIEAWSTEAGGLVQQAQVLGRDLGVAALARVWPGMDQAQFLVGSGVDDLGSVQVLPEQPLAGTWSLEDNPQVLTLGQAGTGFASEIRALSDVDGDGLDELALYQLLPADQTLLFSTELRGLVEP